MALPKAEGRVPDQQRFIITGSHVIPDDHEAVHAYDHTRFYVICELEVVGVSHKDVGSKNPKWTRQETATVRSFAFVPFADGRDLLVKHGWADPTLFNEGDDGE